MKLYMCCYTISSNYFGVGVSKQEAYKDLVNKWDSYDSGLNINEEECSYFELSEAK